MSELPEKWASSTLGQLAGSGQYGWTTKAAAKGRMKFLRTTDITKGPIDWKSVPYCLEPPPDQDKYKLRSGDILISRAGSVGYSVLLESIPHPTIFASYLIRFLPNDDIVIPRYLSRFLQSPKYWQQIAGAAAGIALANVNASKLAELNVPLAPFNEQKRIADKLDSVLARVDACRKRLNRVPAILKRFRQSVLAAATTGKLTEEWREERGISLSWRSATLGEVGSVTGGLTKNPKRMTLPMCKPYLRVANVYANRLELEDVAEIGLTEAEFEKTKLMQGDLLIVEGNGSLDQIGRAALWDGQISECSHQNHLIRWRPTDRFLSKLALFWLLSPLGRESLVNAAKSTAGLHTLSISKVSAIPVMLPLQSEQHEIVRRVEVLLAVADRLDARYIIAHKQVERLIPALLAKAFRGDLVPQDPNDEPASVLLDRIHAARAEQLAQKVERKPILRKPSLASKGTTAMAKSRFDVDVKDRPYLASLLREGGGNAKVDDLFKRAELPVVDFYKQLAWEVEQGHVLDNKTSLKVA